MNRLAPPISSAAPLSNPHGLGPLKGLDYEPDEHVKLPAEGTAKALTLADGRNLFSIASEFHQLGQEAEQALGGSLIIRSFSPNDLIYLQDDEADYLYFIRSGYVRLSYLMEDGAAVLCGILPPGESFGELGIFEGGNHCDMATAIGEVTVAALPIHQYRILRERYPQISTAIAHVVAKRYRAYVELTRMLSLKTLAARIAQALLRLADGLGTYTKINNHSYPSVGAMVTQTDLGLMARGARSNVNRALKAWERERWITLQERSIIILNRPKLEALALQEGF